MTDVDGVRLLWISDFWDGPVSGLARYQGELHWFDAERDTAASDDRTLPRRFVLRRLPPDELARQQEVHADFERLVGTHCCLHPTPGLPSRAAAADQAHFYEKHPPGPGPAYDELPVVATFTSWLRDDGSPDEPEAYR